MIKITSTNLFTEYVPLQKRRVLNKRLQMGNIKRCLQGKKLQKKGVYQKKLSEFQWPDLTSNGCHAFFVVTFHTLFHILLLKILLSPSLLPSPKQEILNQITQRRGRSGPISTLIPHKKTLKPKKKKTQAFTICCTKIPLNVEP